MKQFLIILGFCLVVVAAFAIGGFLGSQSDAENPFSGFFKSSMNAALDSSGIKDQIQDTLYSKVDTIAKKTGVPASKVKKKIDQLDISNWKATTLPSDAKPKQTETIDYKGSPAKVTTYDDPSIVTVDSNGIAVTFEVPKSAQGNLDYLKYM